MAARQAEHQHKEVIRDQIISEQVGDLANVALQNGTDKNGPRLHGTPGVPENVNNKGKLVGPNSLSSGLAMSQYRQESGAISSNSNSEPNLNNTDVDTAKINSESANRAYTQSADIGSEPSYNKVSDSGFPLGYSRGGYCEQPGELQYSPQAQPGIRHNFPGSKPLVSIPPRPPSAGSNTQQRFMSGQSISQQAGPTPTLNQLLQSSNRYGDMKGGEHPYNHWPSSYGVQHMPPGFRNQSPYGGGGPQQPWPGAAHHHLHHPASPAPAGGAPPAAQQQQPSQTPSPQPQQPQPSASPHQQQQQGFSGRPQEAPDAADLTLSGQNSNDSSTGPAPGTPMRPSPSPTGSSGSRSMSPAVGQQNIPMPPRPSSGQSDGSGPARISHSPMATQGGYPQPLAPPPHMHGYKVGAHPGMTPSNQQIPYPSQAQQYSQGSYNSPRPMTGSQYGPNQYGPTPGPGTGSQPPPNSNNMAPGQYPGRGIPNHVPHSQFSGYQGWGNPNMNQGPPPGMMVGPGNHVSGGKGGSGNNNSGGNSCGGNSGGGAGSGSGSSTPVATGPQSGPPSSSAGAATTNVSAATGVTCVVTTGPDGTPVDEASQQSTLSNASAASGEDPTTTPKSRKDGLSLPYHSHPATPQSTVPSPGPTGINSMHEDYEMTGPNNWPRTPASPVFNSHVPPDPYRTKKPDSLGKLYEMDDSVERKIWLDKLLQFMEDRGTPISACPTISKNPLDLFRLYSYVKERGGFMEVTKNKTWKDIAGQLGIGASSSAAYTLRKHYTKNLLPLECHFDRGGIDPQPIINQVEAGSKKKSAKAAPVPSPGSSNSQDSFPAPGSGGASMDGYSYGYPPASGQDYNSQRPPPSSQTNSASPHPGYQGQGGYQYGDQYNRGPPGPEYNQQYPPGSTFPSNRSMYPPYGPEGDRGYNQGGGSGQPPGTPGPDPYNRYQPPGYQPRPGYPAHPGQAPPSSPAAGQQSGQPQDFYRSDQPRRHPDFVKDQPPYPGFNQNRPAMYGGWPNNSQYRGQYPPPGNSASGSQQWSQGPPRPGVPPTNQQPNSGQWCQPSYQSPQQTQQWGPSIPAPGAGPNSSLRPMGSRPPYRQDGKPYAMASALSGVKGQSPSSQAPSPMSQSSVPAKREITFPPDSVEATMPVLYKRKRLTRADVYPVEAWRLMMSLRSGLLSESCWALDTLNILLFDDMSVVYFGLQHMPGLLDILLEHFGKALDAMFDMNTTQTGRKWFEKIKEEEEDVDLGSVTEVIDPADKTQVLPPTCPNYSMVTRKGRPVKLVNRDDVFVLDTRKSWDVHGDAPEEMGEADPAAASSLTKYIVPCFQGEFGLVPFVRLIPGPDKGAPDSVTNGTNAADEVAVEVAVENGTGDVFGSGTSEPAEQPSLPKTEPQGGCVPGEERISSEGCVSENEVDRKRKKRTKCLTDVLNRIKKEKGDTNSATEVNAFPRDCVDKMEVVVKKELEDLVNSDDSESRSNSHDRNEPVEDSKKQVVDENHVCDSDGDMERSGSENDCEESKRPQLRIRDPAGVMKRRRMSDYEDECYTRDEASLYLVTENQDAVARRCVCLSNILRNLTFVPGNEIEFAKNSTFLGLLGKLMLVHHEHPLRTTNQRNYDREEDADYMDSCSSITGDNEWWWDFLNQLRENVLVTMANIAGYVDLGGYPEEISRPLLDGLLHWAVCPAAHGQDPFPTVGPSSALSPQRLALEALCKLCVTDSNVDLVIATPPYSRLERLCTVLTKLLCRSEEQVLREFAVNLLHYLAAADSGMARTVASQTPCVSMLVAFIEQAEQSALGVANQHGIGALRENPDSMGTSLDMLRRAAGTLLHLARHPDNRPLFLQQEQRLLALVMSQVLDQQVAALVSSVLFQCSRGQSPTVHTTS